MTSPESLVIRRDTKELARVGAWIADLSSSNGLSETLTFKLDLCAAEAVTNVIDYAFEDAEDHQIEVQLEVGDQDVTLIVEDNGEPFNPLEVPEPQQADSLAEAQIGGLGVHLYKTYSDTCSYERCDGKNRLSMVLYKDVPSEQAGSG